MTRWRTRIVLALLPPLALLVLISPHRSGAPEPIDVRTYLREPPLPLGPGAWHECAGMPEHLLGRGLYQALLRTGLDFPALALACWLGALAALAAWLVVAARPRPPRPLALFTLAALLFSPAFGANWLLVERGRLIVPVLAVLLMVVLLARPGVWRWGGALCVSLFALGTHEAGGLLWLAALPLCARPGASRAARVALWLLAHNAAWALCYDEPALPEAKGLVRGLLEAPAATLTLLARVVAGALPDMAPQSTLDEIVVAGAVVCGLLWGTAATWRANAERRGQRLIWLCLALGGLAQGIAIAHAQAPLSIGNAVLRELAWGTWLLPVGVLALCSDAVPRAWLRGAPVLSGVLVVLLAQDWHRGIAHLRSEARVLRQAEALLVFADLGPAVAPTLPRAAVADATQRAWLRDQGLLRAAAPSDSGLVGLLWRDGPAGMLLPPKMPAVHGVVHRAAAADLVLVLRQPAGQPARLAKVAAPDVLEAGEHAAWSADLGEGEPFAEGETLRAVAFDLRGRVVRPLAGGGVWRAGEFVVQAP